ncbi:MAG TPA: hypothetical protein DCL66_04720, partial [Gammaproteobacteria bacterium]|nr:hypothetical protein [Gammaproteobacteria bacterium]
MDLSLNWSKILDRNFQAISRRGNLWAFLAVLLGFPAFSSLSFGQSATDFPRPEQLEPAINFWVKVYTEVDTRSGFLHDSEHLSVIYAVLDRDRSAIDRRRKQIQADLRALATGKRDLLTGSQKDILALWPDGVSNQTLNRAAGNVRWQLGQSDRFLGGLQRSGAYRGYINQVVREKSLPIELGVLP